jgi:hypothetical protein
MGGNKRYIADESVVNRVPAGEAIGNLTVESVENVPTPRQRTSTWLAWRHRERGHIMKATPRPLLGSLLGLLLGIVVVALLWQLGVLPPDRLVVFGVLALTVALVTMILTQRVALAPKRFITVMIVCGVSAGVAVTGVPQTAAGGSLTDGCYAEGTSSFGTKTPGDTSVADPFEMTRTDTVDWNASSDDVFTNWVSSVGISVGGFPIKIWNGSSANDGMVQSNSGSEDVATRLADIESAAGVKVAGVYHLYGQLDADQGSCEMSAYVKIEGEGAFAGTLNLVLWTLLTVLVIVIVIVAVVVGNSIRKAATTVAATTVGAGASAAQPVPPTQAPLPPAAPNDGDHANSPGTPTVPGTPTDPGTPAEPDTPPDANGDDHKA